MTYRSDIVHLRSLVGKTDAQIYLIIGPPGAGKEAFALQYMIDGFSDKNNAVFITTDDFPNDIISKMREMGSDALPHIDSKQLQFIDAFSYRTGEKTDREMLTVDNIRDLTGISVILKKLIDTKDKLRLVFNTISTISIYNSGIALLDFIQAQVARLKQKKHSGLILAHDGMMDEKVIQGIKAFVDGVIEFKAEEDQNGVLQRKLRIVFAPNIRKSGWI
ncbi:MAG: RAD55 family ATPase, partial [Candidatus Heimdallarchaeota archaeon]